MKRPIQNDEEKEYIVHPNESDDICARPMSAFMYYYHEQCAICKRGSKKMKLDNDYLKELGKQWKLLPPKEQDRFKLQSEKSKELYAKYKAEHKSSKIPKVSLQTRCDIEGAFEVFQFFNIDSLRVDALSEIGFGRLLDLKCIKLRRNLCKFLVQRFDVSSCTLDVHGRTLKVSPQDVERIMGLTNEGIDVVIKGNPENIEEMYSSLCTNGDKISIALLGEQLKSETIVDDSFKIRAALFILGSILCPTTSLYVKRSFLYSLKDVSDIKKKNWAKFVFEFLVDGMTKFKKRNQNGISGCLLFLMLFYFEHISIKGLLPPLPRGQYPRISLWEEIRIKQVMSLIVDSGGFYSEKVELNEIDSMPCKDNQSGELTNVEGEIRDIKGEIRDIKGEIRDIKGELRDIKGDVIELKGSLNHLIELIKRNNGGQAPPFKDKRGYEKFGDDEEAKKFVPNQEMEASPKSSRDVKLQYKLDEFCNDFGDVMVKHEKSTSNNKIVSMHQLVDESVANVGTSTHQLVDKSIGIAHAVSQHKTSKIRIKNMAIKVEHCETVSSTSVCEIQTRKFDERKRSKYQISPYTVQQGKKLVPNNTHAIENRVAAICRYAFDDLPDRKDEILCQFELEHGTRTSFQSLKKRAWVTDDIITLVALSLTFDEKMQDARMKKWYMPVHFSTKILNGNDNVETYVTWYRKEERYMTFLNACEQIVIPMFDNEVEHWYLCVIHLSKQVAYLLDSLSSSSGRRKECVKKVLQFCDTLFRHKSFHINDIIENNIAFSTFDVIIPYGVPQQKNTYDCGMYVIKFMETRFIPDNVKYVVVTDNDRSRVAAMLVQHPMNTIRHSVITMAEAYYKRKCNKPRKQKGFEQSSS